MRSRLLTCLLLLALAPLATAQDGATSRGARERLWRRGLDTEPALAARIETLLLALAKGDAQGALALVGPGSIKLQIQPLEMPAVLTGRLQARAMLADYLSRNESSTLRVAQARLGPGAETALVSLEVQGGPMVGGRTLRRRFVAGFERVDGLWQLTELRCP